MKFERRTSRNQGPVVIMRFRQILITLVAVAITAMACSREHRDEAGTTDFTDQAGTIGKMTSSDPSDRLADDGEKLLEKGKFNDAFGKFNEALQANKANSRAAFWRAFLRLFLELKGIKKRVAPLYGETYGQEERYKLLQADNSAPGGASLDAFYNDGPEDIRTGQDLQEWMDRYRASLATFRDEIRAIRNSDISISIPAFFASRLGLNSTDDCRAVSFGPIKFDGVNRACGPTRSSGSQIVGLNRADFETVLWMSASFQYYLEIWTAYTADPAAIARLNLPAVRTKQDAERLADALFALPGFGKLRTGQALTGVRGLSKDMVAALRYMISQQSELCPLGKPAMDSRKGYLVNSGLCLGFSKETSEPLRMVQSFEAFIGGTPLDITPEKGSRIRFLPSAFLDHPPQDLRELAPLQFDECKRLVSVNPAAAAPYFEGDFNRYLAETLGHKACLPAGGGK